MKFVGENGMFLFPEEAEAFINSLQKEIVFNTWDKMGRLSHDKEASERHIEQDPVYTLSGYRSDQIKEI